MARPVNISIPAPCHQNWRGMTVNDEGRFCTSCQKSVVDFTKSSDREIASRIGNEENVCGRFLADQLDRDLQIPPQRSYCWIAAASGVLALLGSSPILHAQSDPTEQVPPVKVYTSDNDASTMGKVLPPQQTTRTVSGVVSDAFGPVPGANVVVEGSEDVVHTDIDGKFEIKANQGDKLLVSYIGMNDATYVISDHLTGIEIVLVEDMRFSGELVVMGGIHSHNTFFARLFRSIGNLFR